MMRLDERDVPGPKRSDSIIAMPGQDSNVRFERESHRRKQFCPIIVTEEGTQTDDSDEQLAKV
jgi:hypothetical protein